MATTTKSRTSPSTPRLSDVAKEVKVPSGVVSSGWPRVARKAKTLGVEFRGWQEGAGKLILAKRADGTYASTIGGTGLSIPRQVGKTFLVMTIAFCLAMLTPNMTIIWTAHRERTATETMGKMIAFAGRRAVAPFVDYIHTGSGTAELKFLNGSRILFGARAREFGRGFDEVDMLIFDEAQILPESVLDDMVPATNQSRMGSGALLLFMGTPPRPKDNSEVFTRMREDALSGEDEDTAWVEFGADDGYVPTPKPGKMTKADWEQVAKANPSFPNETRREAILRMRKQLAVDSFPREGLGIWDTKLGGRAFGANRWEKCRTPRPDGLKVGALALAASRDMSRWAVVAASEEDSDGIIHVMPLQHGPTSTWVVQRVKALQELHEVMVVVDGRGAAAVLIPHLEAAGVQLTVSTTGDVLDACAEIYTRVEDQLVGHDAYPELDAAVAGAIQRTVAKRWAWGEAPDVSDISCLEAATLAVSEAIHPTSVTSAYADDHELVII